MGPEPMMRILLMSVRLGIFDKIVSRFYKTRLRRSLLVTSSLLVACRSLQVVAFSSAVYCLLSLPCTLRRAP
jgi:hypothetical protein